jgi:hypothetical protein
LATPAAAVAVVGGARAEGEEGVEDLLGPGAAATGAAGGRAAFSVELGALPSGFFTSWVWGGKRGVVNTEASGMRSSCDALVEGMQTHLFEGQKIRL